MIDIIERRIKRICRMHSKSQVLVICSDKHQALGFSKVRSKYANLRTSYVDFSGLIAYEAIYSEEKRSANLSILIDQEKSFSFARRCAKQFETLIYNLLVDQSTSSRYQVYQAAVENWAFHQAALRHVALLKYLLQVHSYNPSQVVVFALEFQFKSIAIKLSGNSKKYFINTARTISLRQLMSVWGRSVKGAVSMAMRTKFSLSLRRLSSASKQIVAPSKYYCAESSNQQSPMSSLLDCAQLPSKRELSSKTLFVLKAKRALHFNTLVPLLKELAQLGFDDRFDVLDIDGAARATKGRLAKDGVAANVFDLRSLELSQDLLQASRGLAAVSLNLFADVLSREGERVSEEGWRYTLPFETYEVLLNRLCFVDLPHLVKLVEMLRRRFSDDKPVVVVTSTDFHWIGDVVRAVALQAGKPIVCVQNAYMSTSPRYSAPAGDVITVIDSWTRELLVEKFSCDPDAIMVTGTPRFDLTAELARSMRNEMRARPECIAGHSRPTIVFAAQPEDRSVSAIDIIDSLARVRVATSIFIKLHPSAPSELFFRAQRHAAAKAGFHMITVERTGNIYELMKSADVLVTVSSNVGVEAAIADKDIVIAMFQHFDHVLPLDEFDIGLVARSSSELAEAVESVLENENTRALLRGKRQRYAELNPHLFAGDSQRVISRIIVETFTEKATLSPRPIPKLRLATSD